MWNEVGWGGGGEMRCLCNDLWLGNISLKESLRLMQADRHIAMPRNKSGGLVVVLVVAAVVTTMAKAP